MTATAIITITIILRMAETMIEALAPGHLYRLSAWLSPAFPVGAYTNSAGLEYAVEAGLVTDAGSLEAWLSDILRFGSGAVDGTFFSAACRGAALNDRVMLEAVVERADAMRATSELAIESASQGEAFLKAVFDAWPHNQYPALQDVLREQGRKAAYAVAVGAVCGFHGIPLRAALVAFLHAMAANLVSAGVRLIPLGQTEGQRIVSALEPVVEETAAAVAEASIENVGSATPMVDWTSMRHETQYTRLFRS